MIFGNLPIHSNKCTWCVPEVKFFIHLEIKRAHCKVVAVIFISLFNIWSYNTRTWEFNRVPIYSHQLKHSCYLISVGGEEVVVCHLLVEHRSNGTWHGWHYPAPVRGAALPQALLILVVFHERLGCRVVVYNRHVVYLGK